MSDDDLLIKKIDPMDAIELEKKIRPLFAGYHPAAQGSCLASLTALFIAGHIVKGDPKATTKTREGLLKMHVATIMQLIPEAERQILASQRVDEAQKLN